MKKTTRKNFYIVLSNIRKKERKKRKKEEKDSRNVIETTK